MQINREHIENAFAAYVADYDSADEKIRLKVEHTHYVARLCERIAVSLGLSEADVDLAWLCGMLHDIGRFEQVRRFGTFVDARSINHAEFGADLLFVDGLIERFVEHPDPIVELAIRNHNRLAVDPSLDERTRMFCDILRDADKVDIMRVCAESPLEEIYNASMQEIRNASLTPEIEAVFYQKRCVPRELHRTVIDRLVGHFCFPFELVYLESIRQIDDQGHLWHLMNIATDNLETEAKLSAMRAFMVEYLQENVSKEALDD